MTCRKIWKRHWAPSSRDEYTERPDNQGLTHTPSLPGWDIREAIRRQNWLMAAYRLLPLSFRQGVSRVFDRRFAEKMRFQRTPAWDQSAAPLPVNPPGGVKDRLADRAGVNIIGYLRGEFGLGESARLYAKALIHAGIPVALLDLDLSLPHGWSDHSLDAYMDETQPYDTTVIFVNPDYLDAAFEKIGHERLGQRRLIACWFWELEMVPSSWIPAIAKVDEILVSSAFLEKAFKKVTDKPIRRVPLPFFEQPDSGLQRDDFGLPGDSFIFLCSFDFHSHVERKNPQATIRAFQTAFPKQRSDVCLLMKSSNGDKHQEAVRSLLAMAHGDPRIVFRDEVIDRAHMQALQRCCDAYVSLHRGEGFGLGLAECMGLGKPVIATGWSGNLEFMTPANSCLVDYSLVPVDGRYPDSEGARWAEPDVLDAAVWMRRLADDRVSAKELGRKARRDIRHSLSPDQASKHLSFMFSEE